MKSQGKKALLYKLLSSTYSFFCKKKTIVFFAPKAFHFAHVSNVVNKLISSKFNIIVICPDELALSGNNIKQISCAERLPIWQKIDLFITTEFNAVPYWLTTCRVFFGHGIGPKLDYQSSNLLTQFDYLFSPCMPFYDLQKKLFAPDKIFKIGLPILDGNEKMPSNISNDFNIKEDRPCIVYAPSWCNFPEYLTNIDKALSLLNAIEGANVIICPHPNLLDKTRCGGEDLFRNKENYNNLFYNFPDSKLSTLEICKQSDIVISDISSILFESMAIGKLVLFENNRDIFKKFKADDIYQQLVECCFVISWDSTAPEEIINNLSDDHFLSSRNDFINGYLFNRNNATNEFIKCIEKIL